MRVRFWGTRGSLAKPGPTTLRYGGNTPCVEVRTADGTLIILDCGTGAHGLGQALLASGEHPLRGHLLISHTHWDHIQGFPFFGPLFIAGNEFDLYAPGGLGHDLETTLAGQMEYKYFPVTLAQLTAATRFHDLTEGSFAIGGARVVTQYMNHPAPNLGYRVEADGAVVVYSADHEPHAPHHPEKVSARAGDARGLWVHQEDRRHVEFLARADLVIHDAQFTLEEYQKRVGWGHGPAEWAVDYALAAGAKRLALFHHDPLRDDPAVDRIVERCRQRAAAASRGLEVFAAAEGQVLDFGKGVVAVARPVSPAEPARGPAVTSSEHQAVLIVDDDPNIVRLLLATLRSEGFRLLTASDGEAALRIARMERPALILLDQQMPGLSGIEVTRALRADQDPFLREMPVVLITAQKDAEHIAAGFSAGVTDYLIKPFRPTNVRARVHAWLLRRRVGSGSNV